MKKVCWGIRGTDLWTENREEREWLTPVLLAAPCPRFYDSHPQGRVGKPFTGRRLGGAGGATPFAPPTAPIPLSLPFLG